MDIQKEREIFEEWVDSEFNDYNWYLDSKYHHNLHQYIEELDDYLQYEETLLWSAWQAAKDASHNQAALYQSEINHLAQANQQWREKAAQAIPDGFVVVPKEPTLLMQRAGSAEAIKPNLGIASMRDIYKAMIEAQEQK